MSLRILLAVAVVTLVCASCFPTSYEESVEFRILAEISMFSVPDSVPSNNIPVRMSGLIGRTTAYSFASIVSERTDSLFEFAVYGIRKEKTGERYDIKDITFDTTLTLTTNPRRVGLHYFRVYGSNGVFTDSSRLY
ncbi:MAG TPA: hypothetical protein VNL36_04410 [Bacteroidota bacterium]|nr:hypothetical protein [Bacteroidota bacterium]